MRFAHRLALPMGILDPVEGVLGKLTREQLVRWIAFLELEPLAADRDDVRAAYLAAVQINETPLRPDDAKQFTIDDLLIDWAAEPQESAAVDYETATAAAEERMVAAVLQSFGG